MVLILIVLAFFSVLPITTGFAYSQSGADWEGLCSSGKSQSPLSLSSWNSSVIQSDSLMISVSLHPFEGYLITDNSSRITIEENFGSAEINSEVFNMFQIEFHSPSEHTIDGQQFDLEMQLIGRSKKNNYQVIALMFYIGKNPNQFIETTIENFNSSSNSTFDPSFLLCNGELDDYFHYKGSLTAPIFNTSCEENVAWTVLKNPLEISENQLNFFTSQYQGNESFAAGRGNNREIQNLNNRTIWLHPANFVSNKFCSAKKCPRVDCFEASTSETCYSVQNNSHSIYKCSENSHCPDVSVQTASAQTCSSSNYSIIERQEGISGTSQSCCKNNVFNCHQDYFCDEGHCKLKRRMMGKCKSIYQCSEGFVCNLEVCIPYFSVEVGQPANSSIACASAVILDGICQPFQKTDGEIPKACDSDNDCLASDGKTSGTCSCAFDSLGKSFCKLHRSDPDMLKFLAASHEGKNELARFYARLVNLYPVNVFANQCFKEDNVEMKMLILANETKNQASGLVLVLGLVWFVIQV